MLAPQTKIAMQIRKGMAIQVDSSKRDGAVFGGISPGERRRYLTAKKISSPAISVMKKTETPTSVKKNAATSPAKLDAFSGRNGMMIAPNGRKQYLTGFTPRAPLFVLRFNANNNAARPINVTTPASRSDFITAAPYLPVFGSYR